MFQIINQYMDGDDKLPTNNSNNKSNVIFDYSQ